MSKLDKLLHEANKQMQPGEKMAAFLEGSYVIKDGPVRDGLFIATDRRILFAEKKRFKYIVDQFPFNRITSIEWMKGVVTHVITFTAFGRAIDIKWIKSDHIDNFVNYVRSKITRH